MITRPAPSLPLSSTSQAAPTPLALPLAFKKSAALTAALKTVFGRKKKCITNIDSQDWDGLRDRLLEAIDIIKGVDQECNSLKGELATTKSSFDQYKIAFADKMFTSISTHPIIQPATGPASHNQPNHASTLVIDTSDSATDIGLKELDAILGSAEKGPVTETFSKKGNIVYASYKSALESGRAKAILEAKPNLVRTVHTKDKFYPAIALNINVSDLPKLQKELYTLRSRMLNFFSTPLPLETESSNAKVYQLLEENFTRSNSTGTERFVDASTVNNMAMSPRCAPLQPQNVAGAPLIVTPDHAPVKIHFPAATAKGNIPSVIQAVQNKLNHKLASASLAQLLLDKQIDAAIIQEPYVSVQRIEKTILLPDVPPGYSSFHNITSDYILDSNANHPLWNSRSEDKKGQELVNVLSRLPLSVANKPISALTFTPYNTAFIDITLTGDNILCSQWFFLYYPSLSDHPYITYTISHSSTPLPNYPNQNRSTCKSLHQLAHINLELLTCSLSHIHVINYPQTSSQNNFRESRTPLNKAIFLEAKATYQREIRKAKEEHWIRFLQLMNNGHHAAVKEITKKVASVHLPTSTIINGITVNDQKDILKHCSSLFFPSDAPTTPSQLPCLERSKRLISQPILSSSEPNITSDELKTATSSLQISSAAGPDGLYAELITKCLPFIST
uniref:Endonuclease/exonuclease/phosphatase domain-containing protein n=1 Tax=Daphnia galeata TaxID=27404 RepID=A0A8J2S4W2_9CRUS|nr:unnamed protein product [Daphnia galeata]